MKETNKEVMEQSQPLSNSNAEYQKTLLDELSKDFHPAEVRQRAGRGNLKLDYIGIDTTINRLNNILGAEWNARITAANLSTLEGQQDKNGNQLYLAQVTLELQALGATRGGTGASVGTDPDDAIKTAQAEALKKAGNLYGIALYLWDEGKRNEIAEWRKNRGAKNSSKRVSGVSAVGHGDSGSGTLFEF